jgi:hypothetical protein
MPAACACRTSAWKCGSGAVPGPLSMFRNIACGTGLVAMACSHALLAEKNAGTNVRWQPAAAETDGVRGDEWGYADGVEVAQAQTATAATIHRGNRAAPDRRDWASTG